MFELCDSYKKQNVVRDDFRRPISKNHWRHIRIFLCDVNGKNYTKYSSKLFKTGQQIKVQLIHEVMATS